MFQKSTVEGVRWLGPLGGYVSYSVIVNYNTNAHASGFFEVFCTARPERKAPLIYIYVPVYRGTDSAVGFSFAHYDIDILSLPRMGDWLV